MRALAVGTETNGSITCPAALNGVVGIKATVGAIPTSGIVPITSTQDAPGPFARSVRVTHPPSVTISNPPPDIR